jgi:hypothetical protein
MAKEKKVNYTDEQTEALVTAYTACGEDRDDESEAARLAVVKRFADEFGKSEASIRSKLSTEGVYIKKEYRNKNGETPESKSAIVESIATIMGVSSEVIESFEKATKPALLKFRNFIQPDESEGTETE